MRTPRLQVLVLEGLFVYMFLLWFWGVGRLDISDSMEGTRAVVVREMLSTGEFLFPHLHGRPILTKPPLFYWLAAAVSAAVGSVSAATVRWASALSALILVGLVYLVVRRWLDPRRALVAAVVIASTPLVFESATTGKVNMLFALWVAAAMWGGFWMFEHPRRISVGVLCGVALSAALMAKGPVVLLFFLPVFLLYAGFLGRRVGGGRRVWRGWGLLALAALLFALGCLASTRSGVVGGLLYLGGLVGLVSFAWSGRRVAPPLWMWLIVVGVVLMLIVPWVVLVGREVSFRFLGEVLRREVWRNRVEVVSGVNRAPIWFYLVRFPAATLPYSVLVWLAFVPGFGRGGSPLGERGGRLVLFCRVWLLGSVVLFSVVSAAKEVRYLLPAVPPLAVLTADVLVRVAEGEVSFWVDRFVRDAGRVGLYALILGPMGLVAAGFWGVEADPFWTVVAGALALVGAGLAVYLHRRGVAWAPLVGYLIFLLALKVFLHLGCAEARNRRKSPRSAVKRVRGALPAGARLYVFGPIHPAMLFYLEAQPIEQWRQVEGGGMTFVCLDRAFLERLPPSVKYDAQELCRVHFAGREVLLLQVGKGKTNGHPR